MFKFISSCELAASEISVGKMLEVSFTLIFVLCAIGCAKGQDCREGWNYAENGPSEWPSFCESCAGHKQSPVAVWPTHVEFQPDLAHLLLHNYQHPIGGLTVTDKGHTAFVKVPDNNTAYIVVPTKPGKRYKLVQLHFHWGFRLSEGSEHTIGNEKFPIEIHIVHQAADETLAVLGVFGQITCDGVAHACVRAVTEALSGARESGETAIIQGDFTISDFLPQHRHSFYTYAGSLTTPPCSDIVEWLIFADTISIKPHTLHKLRGLRDPEHHTIHNNYRPTQAMHGRKIIFRGSRLPHYNFTEVEHCAPHG